MQCVRIKMCERFEIGKHELTARIRRNVIPCTTINSTLNKQRENYMQRTGEKKLHVPVGRLKLKSKQISKLVQVLAFR